MKWNEQVRLGRFRQQQKNKIQIDTHLSVKSNEQVRLGCFRQQQKNLIQIDTPPPQWSQTSKLGLVVLDNNKKIKIQIDTHLSVKSNKQVRLGRQQK